MSSLRKLERKQNKRRTLEETFAMQAISPYKSLSREKNLIEIVGRDI